MTAKKAKLAESKKRRASEGELRILSHWGGFQTLSG